MQRAGSLGALNGASTTLAHQLPRAVGSASSLSAVPATAVSQACVGPYRQRCGCLVHQPVGRSTITSHVAAQTTARCPHSGGAQLYSRCALTTAHFPQRMVTSNVPSNLFSCSAKLFSIGRTFRSPDQKSSLYQTCTEQLSCAIFI